MKVTVTNDKGFSLVELIVVIAIMAVLVGVVTPQYLGFLEKSHETVRLNRAEDFRRCLELAVLDMQAKGVQDMEGEDTLYISPTGSISPSTGFNNGVKAALDGSFGTDYTGLCVNIVFDTEGIPVQYHLAFEEPEATYEYCMSMDAAVEANLERYGYSQLSDTGWYYQKSEGPTILGG